MDRTLISWNVPNLITVPLMAFGAFLVVAVVYQVATQWGGNGGSKQTPQSSSGF
jgi:hypothetical protein